jgi:signal transduction histidine kinase
MFRVWLAVVSTIAVLFVVTLSAALYWAAENVNENFEAYRHAAAAYERYERLAHESYRYFKSEIERLTVDPFQPLSHENEDRERLMEAFRNLRTATLTSAESRSGDREELHRIAKLGAFLNDSRYQFDDIEQLRKNGQHGAAREQLANYSAHRIDKEFQPLIDESIREHRERATQAQKEVDHLIDRSRWLAILDGTAATLISLYGGILLSRRLSRSIGDLMTGTQQIASGNFSARVEVSGDDEFSTLASHFNRMAEKIQKQRSALEERQDLLETRVAERTQELLDINQNLCRMDRDRRAFLADISHELRTPITVIRGEAEIALRNPQTPSQDYRQALQRISELAVQLGDHVHDLLAEARSEPVNDEEARNRPIDLRELLSEVALDIEILGTAAGSDVQLTLPEKPAWILGDPNRLRQALMILGDNACRYADQNTVTQLELGLSEEWAVITLKDQGIGIAAEEMDHIFDRRFRGEKARQLQPEGLGLGLAMVRSITSQHGGKIAVESEVGQGSTFTLSLPLLSVTPN